MLLAIDVGNTNLVLALGSETDGGLAESGYRIETASVTDAGSCEAEIRHVLGDLVGEIADVVIASVVPAVTPVLAEAVTRITGTAPLVVGEAGVELALQVPAAPRATQGEAGQTVVDRPAGDLADGGDDGRHTDSLHAVRRPRVWARSPCRPRGPPR